jgi:hypothetical protein
VDTWGIFARDLAWWAEVGDVRTQYATVANQLEIFLKLDLI